jgi:hypothetical protein
MFLFLSRLSFLSLSISFCGDETAPLHDPDSAVQKASIDLTDQNDESLPCGSDCSLELDMDSVGSNAYLLPLASPSSLPDDEIDLDASFSQKILVGYIPYRVTVE